MIYDHHRSNIYLSSNTGQLATYNVYKNEWNKLHYDQDYICPSNKKPILWLDHKNTSIIQYAGLNNDHDIEIFTFDTRSNDKNSKLYRGIWDELNISVQLPK